MPKHIHVFDFSFENLAHEKNVELIDLVESFPSSNPTASNSDKVANIDLDKAENEYSKFCRRSR